MKPTRKQILEHKSFLRRQKLYERKYYKSILSYLTQTNSQIAKNIIDNGIGANIEVNQTKLESIYARLYKQVTLNEAEIQYKAFDDPKGKDLIDSLIGLFAEGETMPFRLWRSLLDEFVTLRIASRITDVTNTTRRRIAFLIQKGIEEGLGAREIAKSIREDTDFNRNRSLAIARTETITSANQGKYMAALSSPYIKQKKWLPTNDDRTRLSHLDFWDRDFVEMEQLFFVANAEGFLEQARFPCDSTLSASNTVNCRCIVIFRNKLDENGNVIRRNQFLNIE